MTLCGRTVLGCLLAAASTSSAAVASAEDAAQEAPAVEADAGSAEESGAAPAAESAPSAALPACASATSYKTCTAACREMFPKKPKVETKQEAADRRQLAVHGWWALGTGAALLVAGGVSGGVALHLNAELGDHCDGGVCPPAYHGDLDTRDRLSIASTVLLGAGIAASAVGILILAVFSRPPDDAAPAPTSWVVPLADPHGAGAAWTWRF